MGVTIEFLGHCLVRCYRCLGEVNNNPRLDGWVRRCKLGEERPNLSSYIVDFSDHLKQDASGCLKVHKSAFVSNRHEYLTSLQPSIHLERVGLD